MTSGGLVPFNRYLSLIDKVVGVVQGTCCTSHPVCQSKNTRINIEVPARGREGRETFTLLIYIWVGLCMQYEDNPFLFQKG